MTQVLKSELNLGFRSGGAGRGVTVSTEKQQGYLTRKESILLQIQMQFSYYLYLKKISNTIELTGNEQTRVYPQVGS